MPARVVCADYRDGELVREEQDAWEGWYERMPAREILNMKRASHLARGWDVNDVPGGFDAVKTYSEHGVTKERRFRLVEG